MTTDSGYIRKCWMGALLFASLGIPSVAGASSGGFQAEPSTACDFMAEKGLPTRGGYRASGNTYHCQSRRRNVISGGRTNNSIRFVAQGDAQTVSQVRLELRVNSLTGVQRSYRRLAEYAATLLQKGLGAELSEAMEAAIMGATQGTWPVDGSTVTLKRIIAGGSGYELRFEIL